MAGSRLDSRQLHGSLNRGRRRTERRAALGQSPRHGIQHVLAINGSRPAQRLSRRAGGPAQKILRMRPLALLFVTLCRAADHRVAITIDDLPRGGDGDSSNYESVRVMTEKLL